MVALSIRSSYSKNWCPVNGYECSFQILFSFNCFAVQTANLCFKFFDALGVERDVSISDTDTSYRVPSLTALNRPNAIICKFIRRLALDKVLAAKNGVENYEAAQLGYPTALMYTTT